MARKKMKFAQPKFPNGTKVRIYNNSIDDHNKIIRVLVGEGVVTEQLGEETVRVAPTTPILYLADDPNCSSVHAMECNLEKID